jgi:hypothetical protein
MFSAFRSVLTRSKPIPHKGGALMPEKTYKLTKRGQNGSDSTQIYSKVFRYRLPDGKTMEPDSVEIAGSFTHWQKIPLHRDGKLDSWHTTLHHIAGNRTHHYMLLIDGKPVMDKTCDGLVPPHGATEELFQLMTDKGPRVLMLFAQTK